MARLKRHPVLPVPRVKEITFYFEGDALTAREGEVIGSALFANGVKVFGLHPQDGSPQGVFCANGQCAQCMVIANGLPVKACMEPVTAGMKVHKLVNLPRLPDVRSEDIKLGDIAETTVDLLVIGAGPSGLGAAIEAADAGLSVLVVDDKGSPGGKLLLQTHLFFGSVGECYAATRGIDIAGILAAEALRRENISISTHTMAIGIYTDGKVGIVRDGAYKLIKPKALLVAAGAREKALSFPGCDLPGVYGAGAFQTILNRDLVIPATHLFIVGGGNVGIIAGYHALQAGIQVVGLAEAMPEVGGYWVHANKLKRLGVPIHTSTTVVSANGRGAVESITTAKVDDKFNITPGTYKTYACDTILIAVGLTGIDEIYHMARRLGMKAYVAGDAEEIAEASAAMFSGKIIGRKIAMDLGRRITIPAEWEQMTKILKSKPGREGLPIVTPDVSLQLFPIIHCDERVPCNPCSEVCPQGAIMIAGDDGILQRPDFKGSCRGCARCVAACPGLAITLVDYRCKTEGMANVTLPFELPLDFDIGDTVRAVTQKGADVTMGKVVGITSKESISPCRSACPAGVRADSYIELIRKKKYREAIGILRRDLPLPSVCGRVCYSPCEDKCVRTEIDEPAAIRMLKRFVADWALDHANDVPPFTITHREQIAVVGSGPAGLACANELAHRGYKVTVFESHKGAGGMLRYGIPAYRLPNDILDKEIAVLEKQGIEIKTGTEVKDTGDLMEKGFRAIFIATGAQTPVKLTIEGEALTGVTNMLDFLRDTKTGKIRGVRGSVAVIGGGNSAVDAARTAVRLGAKEVMVIYRRSRDEMPAHEWEIEEAKAEGVKFKFLMSPIRIQGHDGKVSIIECIKMKLGEPDNSGRRRPEPIRGSEFKLPVNMVICAIGQTVGNSGAFPGISRTSRGTIDANEITFETNTKGVFAGGDAVSGASTVAEAFGAGKRAVESIDRYLRGVDLTVNRREKPPVAKPNTEGFELEARVSESKLGAHQRRGNFTEVTSTLTEDAALREATRCLGCGFVSGVIPGREAMENYPVTRGNRRSEDKSVLVTIAVSKGLATRVAGIRVQDEEVSRPIETVIPPQNNDNVIICRCERVTLGKIREAIRDGVHDMNQMKAILKAGLGACGGKTCGPLIEKLLRHEGVPPNAITHFTERPLVAEVPMGVFAGVHRIEKVTT